MKSLESMTGFAEHVHTLGKLQMLCRIRTVNHRFMDLKVRLPKSDSLQLDAKVRKFITGKINRGSIEVSISLVPSKKENKLSLNLDLATQYLKSAQILAKKIGLKGYRASELTVEKILELPGILTLGNEKNVDQEVASDDEIIAKLVSPALDKLLQNRHKEGIALRAHLLDLCRQIEVELEKIRCLAPLEKDRLTKLYLKRVELILKKTADPHFETRLKEEIAFLIDKHDFEEELIRFESHIKQFREMMSKGQSKSDGIGRKLEFLAQEMLRETNTLGTKSANIEVVNCTIEIKSQIERIKEQAANVA